MVEIPHQRLSIAFSGRRFPGISCLVPATRRKAKTRSRQEALGRSLPLGELTASSGIELSSTIEAAGFDQAEKGCVVTWLLGLVMLLACGETLDAQPSEEIALGDKAYGRFDNEEALRHYLKALKGDSSSYQALWKGARAYADVGKSLEKVDKRKPKELYVQGDGLARKVVALYPDAADAHFALALCLGWRALFEGGKTKIRLAKEVKKEADRAIEIDPNHDGAYHILGRWHYNIATASWVLKVVAKLLYDGVPPGASVEEAAEMFAKAIEIDGTKPVHHLEYARTLKELGRYSEARKQLKRCIELPQVQWQDPAHKAEASKMLAEIKDKKDKTSRGRGYDRKTMPEPNRDP